MDRGADFSGIADLGPFRKGLKLLPGDLIDPYISAISIAIRLQNDIIEGISDGPTPEYSLHCREVNSQLDEISKDIVNWIEERGYEARAIPASLWVDTENLYGNISHKAVARMAGIGWQGKSLLLVNKHCGPRIRLTTVLTNMPLSPDGPVKNLCGKCTNCTDACPASAIKNSSTETHFASRNEAIYLKKCYEKLLEFKEIPGIDYTFCGVCIKVCPWGKEKKE
ncbi:MAG: epoxyqueuosine reductase [Nitrospirota bacterium]|nr:MAG: epoxyqueuosine reductase [Nitrospirota bacterium]